MSGLLLILAPFQLHSPATVAHCLLTIKCSVFSQSQCLTAVVGCVVVVRNRCRPPTTSPGGQADVLYSRVWTKTTRRHKIGHLGQLRDGSRPPYFPR